LDGPLTHRTRAEDRALAEAAAAAIGPVSENLANLQVRALASAHPLLAAEIAETATELHEALRALQAWLDHRLKPKRPPLPQSPAADSGGHRPAPASGSDLIQRAQRLLDRVTDKRYAPRVRRAYLAHRLNLPLTLEASHNFAAAAMADRIARVMDAFEAAETESNRHG